MFRPAPPADERALPARFRFGPFTADLPAARVYRDDDALPLEPRAFDLLLLLAANPRRVVGKEEIFERLWGGAFVTDNALTRVVAQLRHQLGDRAESPTVIETVRTRGYRFLPAIEAVEDPEPAAAGPREDVGAEGVTPVGAEPPPFRPSAAAEPPPSVHTAGSPLERLRRLGGWFLAGALVTVVMLAVRGRGTGAPAVDPGATAPVQRTLDDGAQIHPDYSSDGSQLVFAADVGDGRELFVRPLAGGGALQITRDGPNSEPAWSPDGRWIVYRNERVGGLWLVSPTGREVRQLAETGSQPAWSPDARTVVYSVPGKTTMGALEWPATYDSSLWLVDVATGTSRQLTRARAEEGGQGMPVFTADGEWVVYATANLLGGGGLWRVPAAGGEALPIARPAKARTGEWSLWHDPQPLPDGSGLYAVHVTRNARIVRLGWEEGGPVHTVVPPGPLGVGQLALRRDGSELAFTIERPETRIEEVVVDPEGRVAGEPRSLFAPSVRRVSRPRYSPDGEHLLVTRYRTGSPADLVVLDRAGREVRLVEGVRHTSWLAAAEVMALTPVGAIRLDVTSGIQRPFRGGEWVARALELGSPRGVELRADLGAAAVTRQGSGARELVVVSGGAAPRRLTSFGALVDYPIWSRDGRWLGFQLAREPKIANELWRVRVAGGQPQRILSGDGASWAGAFSPDGERVVYAALREGRWHLAVAGIDEPERFLAVPSEGRGYLRWPDWSPDGRRIVWERMRYSANVWTVELPATSR